MTWIWEVMFCSLLMSSGFKVGVNLLLLRGIYSPQERVDGLDSQGQLFCKEGSGLFCSHNLEMVEQQTFYMLYYQHSWASSTSTECHVLPLILTKNAPVEILWAWIVGQNKSARCLQIILQQCSWSNAGAIHFMHAVLRYQSPLLTSKEESNICSNTLKDELNPKLPGLICLQLVSEWKF